jgi:hypothetical protein
MSEPILLASIDLWQRHEARCLGVLSQALDQLAGGPSAEGETSINRRLYLEIIAAQVEAERRGEGPTAPVTPEGMNPPDILDDERAARENKRPDFYWGVIDHLAEPGTARQFVLECKRLTQPSSSWDYIHEYVYSGILRFIREEHGYGKGAPSGAMVGYLQQIEAGDALVQVNAVAIVAGVPRLTERTGSGVGEIELEHALDRSFPYSPYRLSHLWVRTATLSEHSRSS